MSAPQHFAGRHVLICGGSRGIGYATAAALLAQGAHLCLLARDATALESAARQLRSRLPADCRQWVATIACDSTDAARLKPLLEDHIARHGVPDLLINNVGYAYPYDLQSLTLDDHRRAMEVNYFGQLVPTQLLLPHLIAAGRGQIAFVSSMLGFMGLVGYASYAPTKYALVGLAEVLRHELKPHGIHLSVLYPPDTETEGYQRENLSKPDTTRRISANVKPLSAEAVAASFVAGLARKQFHILPPSARWVWRLARWFPGLLHWVLDQELHKARKATQSRP